MTTSVQNDSIRRIVAAAIVNLEADEKRFRDRVEELEAQGYRIIEGGSGYPGDEEGEWIEDPYTDYRTGEVVANDDGEKHYHTDGIYNDSYKVEPVDPLGLPQELVHTIQEWVWENEEEARAPLTQASV
jgi:hypothetical protein